ncbi:MAG TPA: Ig-like domain-containing protein, partial [Armatimonadota bacterium]
SGCGGGSDAPVNTGQASFTFTWPATNVDTPGLVNLRSAQSLRVEILFGTTYVDHVLVNRPADGQSQTTISTITGLPVGDYRFTVSVFDTVNGAGNALAEAAGVVTVAVETPAAKTLATGDADHVMLSPRNVTLAVNGTVQLTAFAMTPTHAILLVPVGTTFTWISDTPAVATVDATGRVTALTTGTATINTTVTLGGTAYTPMSPATITVN